MSDGNFDPAPRARNAATKAPIRIVLSDDHPFVLMGLKLVLDTDEFKVAESCEDGEQAMAAVREHEPDILILDLKMPRKDGFDVLREIGRSKLQTRVIVLSGSPSPHEVLSAVELGARGILGKTEPPARIIECVREVHAGRYWLEPKVSGQAISDALAEERAMTDLLTRRELEIVDMIKQALPNKTIATQLGITEGTVKVHLHRIYEKLGVKGRMDLLLRATKRAA